MTIHRCKCNRPDCVVCKAQAPYTITQKERWENWQAPETLEECVKLFFELVNKTETSDNDVEFKPNRMVINSCRVWDTHRLNKIIPKMKELAK